MSGPPLRHYCTYFDSNYLARGVVLHQSLEEHSEGDFRLYVLCLDERTEAVLQSLAKPTIVPIPLRDVEDWDPELLETKGTRSIVEYYFTLSPILPLYVLEHFDCDLITYLDADLMFFSSPEAIFDELGEKSIFVTEHRFSPHLREGIKYGRFNVQCQSFRRDETGLACLRRWREQCLEWCYDRLENGKFADQKYLDEWPGLYGENLMISQHPGIGVAPWNVMQAELSMTSNQWIIKSEPLVFYHFHGVRNIFGPAYRLGLASYRSKAQGLLRRLYLFYLKRLHALDNDHSFHELRFQRNAFRLFLGGLKHRDIAFVL